MASKLIPRFLQKFHFPKIEAYDRVKIERFQRKILMDELDKAKREMFKKEGAAKENKIMFWESIPQDFVKEEVDRRINSRIIYDIEKLGLKHHPKIGPFVGATGKTFI